MWESSTGNKEAGCEREQRRGFVWRDQRIMSEAVNYRRYLVSLFEPYLSGDVLEVGAGIGNITLEVIARVMPRLRSIVCIEQDEVCSDYLRRRLSDQAIPWEVLAASFPEVCPEREFDCLFHANVLEHIQDHELAI